MGYRREYSQLNFLLFEGIDSWKVAVWNELDALVDARQPSIIQLWSDPYDDEAYERDRAMLQAIEAMDALEEEEQVLAAAQYPVPSPISPCSGKA